MSQIYSLIIMSHKYYFFSLHIKSIMSRMSLQTNANKMSVSILIYPFFFSMTDEQTQMNVFNSFWWLKVFYILSFLGWHMQPSYWFYGCLYYAHIKLGIAVLWILVTIYRNIFGYGGVSINVMLTVISVYNMEWYR